MHLIFDASPISVIITLIVASFAAYFRGHIAKSPHYLEKLIDHLCFTTLYFTDDSGNFSPLYYACVDWVKIKLKNKKSYNHTFIKTTDDIGWAFEKDFYFWWHGPLILRAQHVGDKEGKTGSKIIAIKLFGRNERKIQAFIKEIKNHVRKNDDTFQIVSNWNGANWKTRTITKRKLENVYMDHSVKNKIVDIVKKFQTSQKWYQERGIPWKLCILLHGKAGTGKTSCVKAIAGDVLQTTLYSCNLSNFETDYDINDAWTYLGNVTNPLIAIEDVDTFKVVQERKEDEKVGMSKLSLSAVLNILDGTQTLEGQITFMTTNHLDSLDAAFIRKGRVDHIFEIKELETEHVLEMFNVFFPTRKDLHPKLIEYAKDKSLTAAQWQSKFLDLNDNIESLFDEKMDT